MELLPQGRLRIDIAHPDAPLATAIPLPERSCAILSTFSFNSVGFLAVGDIPNERGINQINPHFGTQLA